MYPVSDACIKAIQSNSRSYFWTGEITTKRGQKYQLKKCGHAVGRVPKKMGLQIIM